jgi:hypothetical protein
MWRECYSWPKVNQEHGGVLRHFAVLTAVAAVILPSGTAAT